MESVTDLRPVIMISGFLQFCGKTLVCIPVLLSVRQLVRVERVSVAMDLVEM